MAKGSNNLAHNFLYELCFCCVEVLISEWQLRRNLCWDLLSPTERKTTTEKVKNALLAHAGAVYHKHILTNTLFSLKTIHFLKLYLCKTLSVIIVMDYNFEVSSASHL